MTEWRRSEKREWRGSWSHKPTNNNNIRREGKGVYVFVVCQQEWKRRVFLFLCLFFSSSKRVREHSFLFFFFSYSIDCLCWHHAVPCPSACWCLCQCHGANNRVGKGNLLLLYRCVSMWATAVFSFSNRIFILSQPQLNWITPKECPCSLVSLIPLFPPPLPLPLFTIIYHDIQCPCHGIQLVTIIPLSFTLFSCPCQSTSST